MVPLHIRRRAPGGDRFFCRLPFAEVNVMEDGRVYPNCCPDWVAFPMGNLREQTWDEVWNGPAAQELRRSMLDGDLRHCDAGWCPHIQNAQRGIADHNVVRREDADTTGLEAAVASGPTNVGMHYDWSCNLACPSCRGEIQQASGAEAEALGRLHQVVVDELLAGARMISLTGTGDPFASQFLRDFLVELDPADHPALEAVHLHTNAIMWTPRLWERMTGLHRLAVSTDISIDAATAATYEVLRQPARWSRLLENLAYITTIPSVRSIGISMTVSAVNHAELVAFHDFGRELSERSDGKVTFVEYKRVRPRVHHTDATWPALALEAMDEGRTRVLLEQLHELEARRAAGAVPEIRSNLGEFLDLALTD